MKSQVTRNKLLSISHHREAFIWSRHVVALIRDLAKEFLSIELIEEFWKGESQIE